MPGVPTLSPQEVRTLQEFVARVHARLPGRVRRVELFGSRARGEGRADSDLDVLILVDALSREERRDVIDLAADLGLASGLTLSPLVMATGDWREQAPLAAELRRDGVAL